MDTRSVLRLASKITIDPDTGCWRMGGYHMPNGYVLFWTAGSKKYAHRLAYEHWIGPIPEGFEVDHVHAQGCRWRDCVRPEHLEAVTKKVNNERGCKGRQTHCVNGHEFTPANTAIRKNGTRVCRACNTARKRAEYQRAKEARLLT